jgi:hypothetical protein
MALLARWAKSHSDESPSGTFTVGGQEGRGSYHQAASQQASVSQKLIMTESDARRTIRLSGRWIAGVVALFWGCFHAETGIMHYIDHGLLQSTHNAPKDFFVLLLWAIVMVIWGIIIFIVALILFIPWAIWSAIFSTESAGHFFVLACVVLWLSFELFTRLYFRPAIEASNPTTSAQAPVKPKQQAASKTQMLLYGMLGIFLSRPKRTLTTAARKTMSTNPEENFYEEASHFRESHRELNLPEVPVKISEYRTWLESLQHRIQIARVDRETAVAIRALETTLVYLGKLFEREELYRKGEEASLARSKIQLEKELLEKEKELRIAKLDADKAEQVARKERYEAEARTLQNPPKPTEASPLDQAKVDLEVAKIQADIDKLMNPKAKPDVADHLTRKLEAINKLEAKMNELVAQASSEEAKARIRTVFREEISKVMEGYKT